MIILPALPYLFTGSYVTYVFLLLFAFGVMSQLIRR